MLNLPKELARQLDERAEEIAALKEALECERATWRRHWKERDQTALTAKRQLAEARAAIAAALNELDEAPSGPNDPFIVAAQERLRAAIQDESQKGQDNADHS